MTHHELHDFCDESLCAPSFLPFVRCPGGRDECEGRRLVLEREGEVPRAAALSDRLAVGTAGFLVLQELAKPADRESAVALVRLPMLWGWPVRDLVYHLVGRELVAVYHLLADGFIELRNDAKAGRLRLADLEVSCSFGVGGGLETEFRDPVLVQVHLVENRVLLRVHEIQVRSHKAAADVIGIGLPVMRKDEFRTQLREVSASLLGEVCRGHSVLSGRVLGIPRKTGFTPDISKRLPYKCDRRR